MLVVGKKAVCLFVLLFFSLGLQAGDSLQKPEKWPWRGVTLDFRTDVKDLRRLKDLIPVNTIRITLKPRNYAKFHHIASGEESLENLMIWANELLDECRELDISAIISMSDFPLDLNFVSQSNEPHAEYKSQRFWQNTSYRKQIIDTAGLISLYFQQRGGELIAYEFLSEPGMKVQKGTKSQRPPEWRSLQNKIIAAVRKNDDARWIVMNPGPGGSLTGFHNYQPFEDDKIIYGAHMYAPIQYTHQGSRFKKGKKPVVFPGMAKGEYWDKEALKEKLSEVLEFQKKYKKPVWIGEFSTARWSPGGRQYLLDLVHIFNSYGWGWAYHSYNAAQSWNPDYDDQHTSSHDSLDSQYMGDKSERWETLRLMFDL